MKAGKLVAVCTRVRMGKSGPLERVQLANQIQGFRIPDRSDAAWENNKIIFYFLLIFDFRNNLVCILTDYLIHAQ